MTEVSNEQVVGLELRHNVEADTLGIRLIVGADIDIEPFSPVAHVLTVMAQRVNHLFARDYPGGPIVAIMVFADLRCATQADSFREPETRPSRFS